MASIKDAVEECIKDNNSVIKFIIYAIPLFLCTQAIMSGNKVSGLLLAGIIFTSILTLGYMLRCTMNVADEKTMTVLPSFNVFGVFFTGLKGAIVLLPIAILSKLTGAFCVGLLAIAPLPPKLILVFSWIIWIIFGSFVYTGYLMYTRRGKVFDAYNIAAISKYCIDILIAVIFMKILVAIVDVILIVPVGYILWLFFGLTHPVSIFFLCLVSVFNISIMGHYLAQVAYEVIAIDEEEKAEDAKYAQMEKERIEKLRNNGL